MAKKAHVPKFGNWGGEDNVPYTAYFDSARKSKAGGAMINPNDPEQNPEAFMFGSDNNVINVFQAPLKHNMDDDIVVPKDNHHIEGHKDSHRRNNSGSGHNKNGLKSVTSETSSDRSNSDTSSLPSNHRIARPERKKNSIDNISFYPPSPGPNRLRNGHNLYDDLSTTRSASVPMFGQWDERDPTSGDGFTVIFNKVKEEKQIAASKFPVVPNQPTNLPNTKTKDARSKRCCCLF